VEEYNYEKEMDKDMRIALIGFLVLALAWSIEVAIVEVVK